MPPPSEWILGTPLSTEAFVPETVVKLKSLSDVMVYRRGIGALFEIDRKLEQRLSHVPDFNGKMIKMAENC